MSLESQTFFNNLNKAIDFYSDATINQNILRERVKMLGYYNYNRNYKLVHD